MWQGNGRLTLPSVRFHAQRRAAAEAHTKRCTLTSHVAQQVQLETPCVDTLNSTNDME